jgi:predicted CoA-binding protein
MSDSFHERLRQILANNRIIAVVGLSHRPDRPSYTNSAYLQRQGYRIIPVNPNLTEALGEKAYASLKEIPEPVDIVDIFRRAEDVPPVVADAIAIGAKVIWMQLASSTRPWLRKLGAAGAGVIGTPFQGHWHPPLQGRLIPGLSKRLY